MFLQSLKKISLWNYYAENVVIPEDPFDADLEVTDGLANLLVGGLIPLGFTGTEVLISHLHPPVKNNKNLVDRRMRTKICTSKLIYVLEQDITYTNHIYERIWEIAYFYYRAKVALKQLNK